MRPIAPLLLTLSALAGCASAGAPDSEAASPSRLLAPGLYEFTATVSGEHTYADGRVEPYTETVHGEVEVPRTTGGILRSDRPQRPGGDVPVIRSTHGEVRLSIAPETLLGTVRVRVPETQRVEGPSVCVLHSDGPAGTGPCISRTREYREEVRSVWRSGTAYLTPVAIATASASTN